MTPAPPAGSKLEELIKAVYEDKAIAETYPPEQMLPFMERLFYDGNAIDPKSLLDLFEPEMQECRKDMPNQMFLYVLMVGLVKIGILIKDIRESAFMVCRNGVGGAGTFSSCINLRLGPKCEPLYVKDKCNAQNLARLVRKYENFNGQCAVHLKEIKHTPEGYAVTHLDIPQDT